MAVVADLARCTAFQATEFAVQAARSRWTALEAGACPMCCGTDACPALRSWRKDHLTEMCAGAVAIQDLRHGDPSDERGQQYAEDGAMEHAP